MKKESFSGFSTFLDGQWKELAPAGECSWSVCSGSTAGAGSGTPGCKVHGPHLEGSSPRLGGCTLEHVRTLQDGVDRTKLEMLLHDSTSIAPALIRWNFPPLCASATACVWTSRQNAVRLTRTARRFFILRRMCREQKFCVEPFTCASCSVSVKNHHFFIWSKSGCWPHSTTPTSNMEQQEHFQLTQSEC